MSNVIIYTRPDGGMTVVHPAPGVDIALVMAKDVPSDATNAAIIDIATLPTDREFRNAWRQSGNTVAVPVAVAKQVARRNISALVRAEVALLEDIRTEAQIENDATLVGQIDARKTTIQNTIIPAIRDGIINATSIAGLKAVRQSYLDGRPQRVKDALT